MLPDDLITVEEVAKIAVVETVTAYRWAASWLPHYKLGARCLRFSRREVMQAIANRRIAGAGERVPSAVSVG